MMKKLKTTKGITLIALIITVIVLLILAGVSINMVIGENGLINKAKSAVDIYQNSATEEQVFLNEIENYIAGGLVNIDNIGMPRFGNVNTYGDYVEYNVDLNDDGDITNDWRIFYAEDNRVYIIAADYLQNTQVPTDIGVTPNGLYSIYWLPSPSYIEINRDARKLFFYESKADTSNANTRCISTLLDTSKWTKFALGYDGAVAIGSPTLEIYIKSWNAKYPSDKLYTSSNTTGNYVSTDGGISTYVNMSSTTGYSNTLYYPYKLEVDSSKCKGYWLASPTAYDPNGVMHISCYGHVSAYGYADFSNSGFCARPLVCLPSGVQANKEGDIWKLI